ncbi:MAG TPA: hypothetical protein VGF99_17275 [Myxococcota bacterium]
MTTHAPDAHDDDDDVSAAPVPRPRAGYRTPKPSWSSTMQAWSPIAAGVLRAGSGVIAYVACLLTLPLHHATPFLIGVSLVMLVGGCTSILKYGRDDVRLRGFSRGFTLLSALIVVVASGIAVVKGPGAFAPDLGAVAPPKPAVDDGTIRFEPG